jgi:hypothetical protein
VLLEVKFEGGLADQHKIPAYDGAKSLEGLTRSVLIVTNYLVEGRVRRREFGRTPLIFNLVAQRPGSFESLYEIAYNTAVIGGPIALAVGQSLAEGVTGNLLTDLLKLMYRRVTGQGELSEVPQRLGELQAAQSGDLEALVEAIEPSIRVAHTVINNGVININVNTPQRQEDGNVVSFTPETKRFVWESVANGSIRLKIFSIASFNANQGTGRAYDLELGRSIPFDLSPDIDRISVNTLLDSIASYTRRRHLGDNIASAVAVRYTSLDAVDGRQKKIRILAVRNEVSDL